jgi:hypothetical protein
MPSKAAQTTETRTAQVGLRFTPILKEAADRRTLASYELVLEAHIEAKRQDGKKPKGKGLKLGTEGHTRIPELEAIRTRRGE